MSASKNPNSPDDYITVRMSRNAFNKAAAGISSIQEENYVQDYLVKRLPLLLLAAVGSFAALFYACMLFRLSPLVVGVVWLALVGTLLVWVLKSAAKEFSSLQSAKWSAR